MEWLNKFTNPLAERTKSPLYGAFLFSWVIWNWRIVLTVLMPSQVKFEGLSLTTYISTYFLNVGDGLVIPLLYAAFYIFALPWIDLFLIGYTEEQKRKKVDEKIKIGRKHFVEGNLYFDLKLRFEEERKKINELDITNKVLQGEILKRDNKLVELDGKISGFDNEKFTLQKELGSERSISHELRIKNDQFENRKNLKARFEGRWTLTYIDMQNFVLQGTKEIEIIGNEYWIINGPNNREKAFEITLVDFDLEQKYFSFAKLNLKPGENHIITTLNIISNNRFEGYENKTISVTYTKGEFIPNQPVSIFP